MSKIVENYFEAGVYYNRGPLESGYFALKYIRESPKGYRETVEINIMANKLKDAIDSLNRLINYWNRGGWKYYFAA